VGIARKWVFPIIRIVIFVAIAAALVKLAFFADPAGAEAGGVDPTGQIVEPQVPATVGTIRNDVVLDGTVNADAAIPVRATGGGEVREVLVARGQAVAAGTEIAVVRAELINSNGTPYTKTVRLTAGADGILSAFTLLVGQTIAVGDTVGQVAPTTFNVTASLSPEQQYRLLAQPTEAEVAVTGGPAPFACTGLTITTPLAGAAGGDGAAGEGGGSGSGSGTTVTCHVPVDVKVFSGLAASMTIAGGIAEDVLTIPMTAVQGAAESGIVYVVLPDGSTEEREVSLGINDGVSVEVTAGLDDGEVVLQFVPGAAAPDPGMEDGGVILGDVAVVK
jgi:membrane fusion protein, macrolide-specific efflux system